MEGLWRGGFPRDTDIYQVSFENYPTWIMFCRKQFDIFRLYYY